MAFSFDSPLALAGIALMAVAAAAFRMGQGKPQARLNLRFAACLLGAPAAASLGAAFDPRLLAAAYASFLIVAPLASVALALSVAAPRPAAPWAGAMALATGLAAGIYAALADAALPVVVVIAASAIATAIWAYAACGRWRGARLVLAAIALLAGGLALSQGTLGGALWLIAAGLLGFSSGLKPRVQQHGAPA